MKSSSVLNQIASIRTNKLAGLLGFILGGFVPCAVFNVAHYQVAGRPTLWLLVAGGLLYSATTVFQWGKLVFGHPAKALGFVVLIELSMTFAHGWVPVAALVLLALINGVAAAHALVVGQPQAKQTRTVKVNKSRKPRKAASTLHLVQEAA